MPDSGKKPPVPLPSATVVLVRDGRAAPEVLLVRRRAGAAFGASYVFPGGLLDAADGDTAQHGDSDCVSRAGSRLGLQAGALDYYCAAIRELFEETGVLLVHDAAGEWPATDAGTAAHFSRERSRLNAGTLTWNDLLRDNGLLLACDRLHYFAYWITPRLRGRRYTTRFFVSRLPAGQAARHDGGELTDSRWLTVEHSLAAHRAGDIVLPPPTRATLRDLAEHGSVAAIVDWAREREHAGVRPLLPAIVAAGDGERIVLPDHPDYPADHRGALE